MSESFSLTPDIAAGIAQKDPVLSQNTEPGFANTYGPGTHKSDGQLGFALPALGVSALGLYLLYQKYQQDQRDKEQEKLAAIDLEALRAQLPGLHVPDLLLGGAAGAGAGMLYDYIRGGEKGKRFGQALRRILTGAAVGAGATNLAGDRFRRYMTNSVIPAGYDAGNILSQLKPRSWQHVSDAAIKDKPSYDPAKVKEFVQKFKNTEIGQRILAARREIDRIGMGVNTHNPAASVWQRNKDKTYSINEQNPEYLRNLAAIMLPSALQRERLMTADELGVPAEQHPSVGPLLQNPRAGLEFFNKGPSGKPGDAMSVQVGTDMFGTNPLLGAQQLITRQSGDEIEGLVLDRHDVTPSPESLNALSQAILSGKALDPKWRAQTADSGYERGQTNSQMMFGTLGRLLWDRVLRHENPWVSQKFKFTPAAGPTGMPEYGLQMLKQDNTPAFSQPFTRGNLFDYLESVQTSDTMPTLK